MKDGLAPDGMASSIDLTRREKVAERVAREILDAIVTLGYPAGHTLPSEADMLRRFGVGRASLREALRLLEVFGLIHVRPGPGGGPVVGVITGETFGRTSTFFMRAVGATLGELLDARAAIEPMMARFAAEKQGPDARAILERALREGRDHVGEPATAWGRASSHFHSAVIRLSGNKALTLVAESLLEIYAKRLRPAFPASERDNVLHAHDEIAEAILAGDGNRAEALMREHEMQMVAHVRVQMPGLLDEIIDWR